ncbi:zinc C2H2 type domain-containing protein [Cryptosporidium andersoni]|uniref:Zinc C2H2 type domain-containing protein n=1 Tax=Cryptosporidium andersoni TaxID=117008 RepID=A0A1J4MYK9_9CRYT|nr:zinc C2H2 type domain-containing protein [Cryptosporidium andersoni]
MTDPNIYMNSSEYKHISNSHISNGINNRICHTLASTQYMTGNSISYVTVDIIRKLIEENYQLLYGLHVFLNKGKCVNDFAVRALFSRLQRNLIFLAHLNNQPKAQKNISVNDVIRPIFPSDYSLEVKKSTLSNSEPNSVRSPNILTTSPLLTSNATPTSLYDPNSIDYRANNPNNTDNIIHKHISEANISNNCSNSSSIPRTEYELITSGILDYDIVGNSVGISMLGSSTNSNNNINSIQNNEHFICRYCQRKCRNQSGLTQHTMKVHPDAPEVQHLIKQAQSRSTANSI